MKNHADVGREELVGRYRFASNDLGTPPSVAVGSSYRWQSKAAMSGRVVTGCRRGPGSRTSGVRTGGQIAETAGDTGLFPWLSSKMPFGIIEALGFSSQTPVSWKTRDPENADLKYGYYAEGATDGAVRAGVLGLATGALLATSIAGIAAWWGTRR